MYGLLFLLSITAFFTLLHLAYQPIISPNNNLLEKIVLIYFWWFICCNYIDLFIFIKEFVLKCNGVEKKVYICILNVL